MCVNVADRVVTLSWMSEILFTILHLFAHQFLIDDGFAKNGFAGTQNPRRIKNFSARCILVVHARGEGVHDGTGEGESGTIVEGLISRIV